MPRVRARSLLQGILRHTARRRVFAKEIPSSPIHRYTVDMAPGRKRDHSNSRTLVHRVFTIGILVKGLNGVLEIVAGILLFLVPPETIRGMLLFLSRTELIEDPHDLLATYLVIIGLRVISPSMRNGSGGSTWPLMGSSRSGWSWRFGSGAYGRTLPP